MYLFSVKKSAAVSKGVGDKKEVKQKVVVWSKEDGMARRIQTCYRGYRYAAYILYLYVRYCGLYQEPMSHFQLLICSCSYVLCCLEHKKAGVNALLILLMLLMLGSSTVDADYDYTK